MATIDAVGARWTWRGVRYIPGHISAVVLVRLAIGRVFQGKRLGRALLADVVQRSLRVGREVSARLVIVHAISPAAEAFHLHHGFGRLPDETRRSPSISSSCKSCPKGHETIEDGCSNAGLLHGSFGRL